MKRLSSVSTVSSILLVSASLAAQQAAPRPVQPAPQQAAPRPGAPTAGAGAAAPSAVAGVPLPADYTIGPEDVLRIDFWREKDMSMDVTVRPDGKITMPLVNDIMAAGLTPEQLRVTLTRETARFLEDPAVTVIVKTINSRKIYITGEVAKPGTYTLTTPTTVMQFIAIAGGVNNFAKVKDITILRYEAGKQVTFPFDYQAVAKRTKLFQNILLQPGDTVVVP